MSEQFDQESFQKPHQECAPNFESWVKLNKSFIEFVFDNRQLIEEIMKEPLQEPSREYARTDRSHHYSPYSCQQPIGVERIYEQTTSKRLTPTPRDKKIKHIICTSKCDLETCTYYHFPKTENLERNCYLRCFKILCPNKTRRNCTYESCKYIHQEEITHVHIPKNSMCIFKSNRDCLGSSHIKRAGSDVKEIERLEYNSKYCPFVHFHESTV